MNKNLETAIPVTEHLWELRDRLIKSSVALLVGTIFGALFARQFLEILIWPLGDARPQSLRPAENIVVFFKVALILGLILAMPVIVYQLVRFITPGLTSSETRLLLLVVPSATFLFALGVAFSAFFMLPFTLRYLSSFLSDLIQPQYSIDYYISFVFNFVIGIGLSFEIPLIVAFLARIGLLSPLQLRKFRRYAIVIIAIVSAVITPTPDPLNMLLVMIPLLILYEIGVFLAGLVHRPRVVRVS